MAHTPGPFDRAWQLPTAQSLAEVRDAARHPPPLPMLRHTVMMPLIQAQPAHGCPCHHTPLHHRAPPFSRTHSCTHETRPPRPRFPPLPHPHTPSKHRCLTCSPRPRRTARGARPAAHLCGCQCWRPPPREASRRPHPPPTATPRRPARLASGWPLSPRGTARTWTDGTPAGSTQGMWEGCGARLVVVVRVCSAAEKVPEGVQGERGCRHRLGRAKPAARRRWRAASCGLLPSLGGVLPPAPRGRPASRRTGCA